MRRQFPAFRARQSGSPFGDRISAISRATGSPATAFIAFAVVVLVALGRRRQRDGETDPRVAIAGIIGLVVTIAAAYAVWVFVTAGRSQLGFPAQSWWVKLSGASSALAAVAIGAVAAGAARALRTRDLTPKLAPLRPGARVLAALLAASAVAYTAFAVLMVWGGYDIPVNDLIAELVPYALPVTALALAAALVMAASRPDVDGRDELNDAVDVVVGLAGTAALAVSAYSIRFILFVHHTSQASFFARANAAGRWSQAGAWVPVALLGAAALHLVLRGRQVAAVLETEREIEALDLLS